MIWDSNNLNAPHTLRELAQDENSRGLDMAIRCASCGARHHSLPEMWPDIGATVAACPNCKPATLRDLAAEADTTPSGATEQQDATSPSAGLSGAATAHAVIAIVEAERASWPHAGPLHDGARQACDNIIAKLRGEG